MDNVAPNADEDDNNVDNIVQDNDEGLRVDQGNDDASELSRTYGDSNHRSSGTSPKSSNHGSEVEISVSNHD